MVVFALMIQTYHRLYPKVQCVKNPVGRGWIHLWFGQSSQTKCESIYTLLYMDQLNLFAFPWTFQWICLCFEGCFSISTISVFVILFLLVLSGNFLNPPLLLSFGQIFLFRHVSKILFNLSSTSNGPILSFLIHFVSS